MRQTLLYAKTLRNFVDDIRREQERVDRSGVPGKKKSEKIVKSKLARKRTQSEFTLDFLILIF